jgi:GTPase
MSYFDDENDLVYDYLYIAKDEKLRAENEEDNIEYKLRIDLKSKHAFDKMVSQMLYRMNVGRNLFGTYEAHYIFGIMDDGSFPDENIMTTKVFNKTNKIFEKLCERANCNIINKKTYIFANNRKLLYIKIKKEHLIESLPEYNLILYGIENVGKSSLMSKILYEQYDDGNGFSRKLVLRHLHEKKSGSTSSITYDTIGFNNGNLVNYSNNVDFNMENIYKSSDKIINVIDIPGIYKQIKVILHGIYSNLSNTKNNIIVVLISCESVLKTDDEIIFYKIIKDICEQFNITPIICLTKTDIIEKEDNKLLDIHYQKIKKFFDRDVLDIINLSNLDDTGYCELINAINNKSYTKNDISYFNKTDNEKMKNIFCINEVFNVPNIGNIYHGKIIKGSIKVKQKVNILCNGVLHESYIKSIQKKTMDVDELKCNSYGCITLKHNFQKHVVNKTALMIADRFIQEDKKYIFQPNNPNFVPDDYLLFNGNLIDYVKISRISNNIDYISDSSSNNDSDDENNDNYIIEFKKYVVILSENIALKNEQNNIEFGKILFI